MRSVFGVLLASLVAAAAANAGQPDDDLVTAAVLAQANPHTVRANSSEGSGFLGNRSRGSALGVDSLPNWTSYFYFPGVDSNGGPQFTWPYTMVGNSPLSNGDDADHHGHTTTIGAPVVPVRVDLREADGSPRFVNGHRLVSDPTPFVAPTIGSPVFQSFDYSSSERPTQFADAIQRAEFFHKADDDWHTMLRPSVQTPRTLVLLRGSYRFALNGDGSCCAFILADANAFVNAFFPATATDTTTPIGAAENAGDVRTADLASFLFPNTFLYIGNPTQCCIIGFHTYDVEPGAAANGWREKRYVLDYSSWVSPGLFNDPTFGDITALSHEIAETFNDPFVNNATPWWLAPNGNCQNNLETGDGIEGLPNAQFPITLHGFTYHPQNEALLQWFAGVTPSSAISGAYSYPDTTVLTAASKSMNVGCQ